MADYTVKRFDEMEPFAGGMFRRARASLGASAFGMQVMDVPAGVDFQPPPHDHAHDGQEEVYVVLGGSAEFELDGDRTSVGPETAVRVAPTTKRRILPGPDGVRILAVGGVPGGAYTPPVFTELGGPEPGQSS
jgi:mannose-6-phosphate isomerase-like protein (cupin superfamily)